MNFLQLLIRVNLQNIALNLR